MNLELSIDRELEFMIKYGMTADELFLYKLIFYAQEGHGEFIHKFFSQCNLTKDIREILLDLQAKGLINQSYEIPPRGTEFQPMDVDLNKNVLHSMYQHSQDLGMELFETYPSFTVINGKTFSLRNITKLYRSLDEMCWDYGKAIKFNLDKHREVMDLLQWAKDNNMITSGLCDFIASHKWLDIKQMQDGEMGTFNTVELI